MEEESEKKDVEKTDTPPPSLSKPSSPPPPSLTPARPAPPIPERVPSSGPPPEIQPKMKVDDPDEVEDENEDGAPAPLNSRLLAGVIDALVAASLFGAVLMILPDMLSKLSGLVWGAYWVLRDSLPLLKGQSIGKMAMKLRVEKLDGTSMISDWQTAIVRNVALVIAPFQLIEAIVLISRDDKPEKGRRLGDEWAKTKVVVSRGEAAEPTGGDAG